MNTFISYARQRYGDKRLGFGATWVRWLWLDALLFATARWWTLHSPRFHRWCSEVNTLFVEQYDWPRQMTEDTGVDCWIDPYWDGMTPQDAVDSEVSHWDG